MTYKRTLEDFGRVRKMVSDGLKCCIGGSDRFEFFACWRRVGSGMGGLGVVSAGRGRLRWRDAVEGRRSGMIGVCR